MNSVNQPELVQAKSLPNAILEVRDTGHVLQCDRTGNSMHVYHFKTNTGQIAGIVVAENAWEVGDAFDSGHYSHVPWDYAPSSEMMERVARARLAGEQAMPLTTEMAGDYNMLHFYTEGLQAARDQNHLDICAIIDTMPEQWSPDASRLKEIKILSMEAANLDKLYTAAGDANRSMRAATMSYRAGYLLNDLPEAAKTNNSLLENYLLGVHTRDREVQVATNMGIESVPGADSKMQRIKTLYRQIDQISQQIEQGVAPGVQVAAPEQSQRPAPSANAPRL